MPGFSTIGAGAIGGGGNAMALAPLFRIFSNPAVFDKQATFLAVFDSMADEAATFDKILSLPLTIEV